MFNSDVMKVTEGAIEFVGGITKMIFNNSSLSCEKIVPVNNPIKNEDGSVINNYTFKTERFVMDRKNLLNLVNKLVEWFVDVDENTTTKLNRMKSMKQKLGNAMEKVVRQEEEVEQE